MLQNRAGHAVADFVGTAYFNSDHSPAHPCPPLPSKPSSAVHLGIQQIIHMDFSHQILNKESNEIEYFHQREQYRVFSGLGCEE